MTSFASIGNKQMLMPPAKEEPDEPNVSEVDTQGVFTEASFAIRSGSSNKSGSSSRKRSAKRMNKKVAPQIILRGTDKDFNYKSFYNV